MPNAWKAGTSAAAILLLTTVTACSTSPRPVAGPIPTEAARFATGETAAPAGVIMPGDTLSIVVYREPDASLPTVLVGTDGTIAMPLVGTVRAAGLTPTMLAGTLTRTLNARFLVDPKVTVNVVQSPSRSFSVEGAVTQPGVYPLLPNTTLLNALAQSRGPTRTARLKDVAVLRTTETGRYLAIFNVEQIRSGRSPDVILEPSDTVIVAFSGARQAWQDFLQSAPVIAIFTRL